jgi:histidinol-phosphate phosphatase family protein
MNSAVFLDLNGTLVEPVQVTSPEQYQPIPGHAEAIRLLNKVGLLCPVITVQGRIGRGMYTDEEFQEWFSAFQANLESEGASVLGPYVCPHRARTECECKKPKPYLYLKAAADFDISCERSYVVGDTSGDIKAAIAIGAKGCFVETDWAAGDLPEYGSLASFVSADILAVAKWIVTDMTGRMTSTD